MSDKLVTQIYFFEKNVIAYSSFIHLAKLIVALRAVYVTYYCIYNGYHFCSVQIMNQPLNQFFAKLSGKQA